MKVFGRLNGVRECAVIGFCLIALCAQPEETPAYWQLAFSYTSQSLSLVRADPIPAMSKQVRSPGALGAPLEISYELTWLDAKGGSLLSTHVEMPIGIRAVLDGRATHQTIVPDNGVIVVRVEGPAGKEPPRAVRLARKGVIERLSNSQSLVVPRVFRNSEFILPFPKDAPPTLDVPGPTSTTCIRNTGDNRNRLVIVVMGDGYTSANLAAGKFTSDTLNLTSALGRESPWDVYFAATNIYRLDVESKQEGADEPPNGIFVDTYLNASFWYDRVTERLLNIDTTGRLRAMDAANRFVGVGVWDYILILVNSTKYGGAGGPGPIAVSSLHPNAAGIVPHELGHSFADLADEYETGGTAPPKSDDQPNVDFHFSGPGLKWLIWVEPGTPLPTPETQQYANVVGAFEGAAYFPTGIYRPCLNCLMRALGLPFCPICREAHAIEFTKMIDFADSVTPPVATVQLLGAGQTRFAIRPVPLSPLAYEWTLGPRRMAGATSCALTLSESDLPSASAALELKVSHPTPFVRSTAIFKTYRWSVTGHPPSAVNSSAWAIYE